jgi:hypothetical protein
MQLTAPYPVVLGETFTAQHNCDDPIDGEFMEFAGYTSSFFYNPPAGQPLLGPKSIIRPWHYLSVCGPTPSRMLKKSRKPYSRR